MIRPCSLASKNGGSIQLGLQKYRNNFPGNVQILTDHDTKLMINGKKVLLHAQFLLPCSRQPEPQEDTPIDLKIKPARNQQRPGTYHKSVQRYRNIKQKRRVVFAQ